MRCSGDSQDGLRDIASDVASRSVAFDANDPVTPELEVAADLAATKATHSTHSITTSASNCIEFGKVRPSILAVFKLMAATRGGRRASAPSNRFGYYHFSHFSLNVLS